MLDLSGVQEAYTDVVKSYMDCLSVVFLSYWPLKHSHTHSYSGGRDYHAGWMDR